MHSVSMFASNLHETNAVNWLFNLHLGMSSRKFNNVHSWSDISGHSLPSFVAAQFTSAESLPDRRAIPSIPFQESTVRVHLQWSPGSAQIIGTLFKLSPILIVVSFLCDMTKSVSWDHFIGQICHRGGSWSLNHHPRSCLFCRLLGSLALQLFLQPPVALTEVSGLG